MSTKTIADNRKARFDYELIETFEAGLVLRGSEVKSIRAGQIRLKDAYVAFQGDEAFLQNSHIAPYGPSSTNNHEPERLRKLLLQRRELEKLMRAVDEKGLSLVPTRIYLSRGLVKVQIALARGKKRHDKRQDLKKKTAQREVARAVKRSRS